MSDDNDEYLSFDDWSDENGKFALRVQGDSMAGDHIVDGDFVVIQKQARAESGQIVAVPDDEGDVTLRRLYRQPNGSIRLETSNGKSSVSRPADTPILGVLVGVVRKF